MRRLLIAILMLAGLGWPPPNLHAETCSGLPTSFSSGNEFPKGNFMSNFDNDCYLIPLSYGSGGTSEGGDLNSIYSKIFFNINSPTASQQTLPPYEIVLLGDFPNARYFSIGLYDDHSAITQNITDVNIVPLTSGDINPYEPGIAFENGQRYGAIVNLGGTPGKIQTGCMMDGYNFADNSLDGTQRHPYMDWNLDKQFLELYPPHVVDTPEHTNPNDAGVIIIRSYLDLTAMTSASAPHVIIRDVASGCAYPSAYINSLGNIVTTTSATGNVWQEQQQVQEHNVYAEGQPTECWGEILPAQDNTNIQWLRQDEYVAGANPDAGYLIANVPSGLAQSLNTAGEVLLIQFQVPTTPPTPCVNGCSRTGNEEMRYTSISFQIPSGGTLASLPDSCPANPISPCSPLIQDSHGNVNLVVGFGVPQPANVTPANGYTWLDLAQVPNYLELNEIAIRQILPSSFFYCAAQTVPYKVAEATTAGGLVTDEGLMGLYSPWINEMLPSALPSTATPPTCPKDSNCYGCHVFPSGLPTIINPENQTCSVQAWNPMTITEVTTQCGNPQAGCTQVVEQANPPIRVVGTGFGTFPLGLPYNGNSNFVGINDATQGWTAGLTGNPCTLAIGEWTDGEISMIANVNQNGVCPMVAGDKLNVTVWNPKTLTSTSTSVTVQAQTDIRKR